MPHHLQRNKIFFILCFAAVSALGFFYVVDDIVFVAVFQFETDLDKARNLMLIPQCFELEVYAEKRLTKVKFIF